MLCTIMRQYREGTRCSKLGGDGGCVVGNAAPGLDLGYRAFAGLTEAMGNLCVCACVCRWTDR